jgi:hypothetical protein
LLREVAIVNAALVLIWPPLGKNERIAEESSRFGHAVAGSMVLMLKSVALRPEEFISLVKSNNPDD